VVSILFFSLPYCSGKKKKKKNMATYIYLLYCDAAMLIKITDPSSNGPPEWILLDLQGKLFPGAEGGDFSGLLLGHLRSEDKRLVLHLGNHNISGTFKDLSKPLHVVERKEVGDGMGAEEYIVKCIVKRKLVFTDRPQPVISAATQKKTT